jgi:hypothetical protein
MTINPDDFRPAVNFIGDSQWSSDPLLNGKLDDFRIYNYGLSAAEITALLDTTPAPPSGLAAFPKNGRIDLTWIASQGAQTYTVKRSATSGGSYSPIASGLTSPSFSDTGLTNGTPYFYIVTATNTHGESNPSPEISATPSELLVHLKFDETNGTNAADASGNEWSATLEGAAAFVPGKNGNAVSLPGASADKVTLPNGVVSTLNDFTITAWVRPNTFGTWARIFDFGTGTTNYMFLTTQYTGTAPNAAKPRFAFRVANAAEQGINSSIALTAGAWSHVAVTLSGNTLTIYVDGTAAGINTSVTNRPSQLGITTQNWLGDSMWSGDPSLNGLLDDFRIYTRALSAAEISAFQTALTAPQSLAATPGPLEISLAWTAVPSAPRYNVKSATVSGGPYNTLAAGITTTSYTHTALPWGTTRYYVVSAENITGGGPDSVEVAASPASPLISASEIRPPTFVIVAAGGGQNAFIRLTSAPSVVGHAYRLQTTDDLAIDSWTDLGDWVAGTGSAIEFTAPHDPGDPCQFFRIHISR